MNSSHAYVASSKAHLVDVDNWEWTEVSDVRNHRLGGMHPCGVAWHRGRRHAASLFSDRLETLALDEDLG